MSITRIQNNQITDSTIVGYAKLQSGSLTGNLFASTLTINSNVTINGNLFLSNTGNTTTINATNTYINDPMVVFNNGYGGSLTGYDIGMLVNRNLTPLAAYGSVNTAWVWAENDQAFEAIATTDTGTGSVSITNSGFANIKIGNSIVVGTQTASSMIVSGAISAGQMIASGTATFGGGIQNTPIGNATPNTGAFTTLSASTSVTFNTSGAVTINPTTAGSMDNVAVGVTTPASGKFTTLTATGALTANTTNQSVSVGAASGTGTTTIASGAVGSMDNIAIGTTTASTGRFTTATVGGLQAVAIGNVTPGTAAFTTLSTSGVTLHGGNVVITSGTDVTASTGVGALMITGTGGASIYSNVSVGNNLYVGGAGAFGQSLAVAGIVVSKAGAQYAQIALKNTTNTGSADYAAYADNGSDAGGWVDMGVAGSAFSDPAYTITKAQDGYLITRPSSNTYGGNLVIGTSEAGSYNDIAISVGSFYSNAEVARFHGNATTSGYLALKQGTAATNVSSGALQVSGGVGITGAAYAGSLYDAGSRVVSTTSGAGNLTITGNSIALTTTGPGAAQWGGSTQLGTVTTDVYGRVVSASNIALSTVAVTNLGNTSEITSNSSVGIVGLNLTTTGVTAGIYGNATYAPTINVDSKGRILGITTNLVPTTFTVAGTSGTTTVSPNSTLTFASTNGVTVAVGATYANISTPQDVRTTANPTFNNITGASFQGVIGNVTASSGTFTGVTATTVTASGITQVTNATQSTGSGTGALQVTGGASIGGNLYVAGNLSINGTMTYINSVQEIVSGIEIVAGNLVANSGTASTSTTTGALVVLGGVGISGNINANVIQATIGSVSNPVTGYFQALSVPALNNTVIGNVTPSTAFFTTANAGTVNAATIGNIGSTLTGTLQTAAQTNVTSVGTLTSLTVGSGGITSLTNTANNNGLAYNNGALQVSGGGGFAGNVYVGGNVIVAGNVFSSTGNINVVNITGSIGQFFGNSAGFGALYAGIPIGYVYQPQTTLQVSSNFNGYSQVNSQNINSGSQASSDYIATANNGTANDTYIDLGIASSTYSYPGFGLLRPNDGYVLVYGNTVTRGGNLVLGAGGGGLDNDIIFAVGGFDTANEFGRIDGTGNIFVIKSPVPSTSTTTGAITVAGGVGISGNLFTGPATHVGNVAITSGGGLTTTQTTGYLFNDTATTLNIGSAATTLNMGSSTGTATINNATISAPNATSWTTSQATVNFLNTPTAINAFTSATGISMGSSNGAAIMYMNPPTIVGSVATQYVYNTIATTVNAFGAASSLNMGTSSGTTTIANPTITFSNATTLNINGASPSIVTNSSGTASVFNTNATAVNAFGAATTIAIGNTGGTTTVSGIVKVTGNIVAVATTATNDNNTGAIVSKGGIALTGNLNAGGQMFVGASAQATVLTSAIAVKRGTSTTGAGTQYTQDALINATNTGSSDFIAYGNNYPGPTNDHGWMDMGFTGDAFSDPVYSITKANDGYLFASGANATVGGNLVLSTDYTGSYNDIVIGVGSFYANSEVARFHGNASNGGTFVVKLPNTPSGAPTANTGAFQVWGSESISGNSYVGGAMTVNGSQSSNYDFKVSGVNTTNLLWARPNATYDTVIVGNTLPTGSIVNGAKLIVNSTDSILLPVGTSVQRPTASGLGTDTAGMLRYNTTLNALEFYNGSAWVPPSATTTVITDQQFTGTGALSAFTLSAPATTASAIVSINGVIQIPTLAYSISGSTLTFTENPVNGDVIDVRVLTTSTSVTSINDLSSYNSVNTVTGTGVVFTTGNVTNTKQYVINPQGAMVTYTPNVTVATSGITAIVDSFYANTYSSAKYLITSTIAGTAVRELVEVLLLTDGTSNAYLSVYGNVRTAGNVLTSFTANVTGSVVNLNATTTNNNTILRIKRDYQAL